MKIVDTLRKIFLGLILLVTVVVLRENVWSFLVLLAHVGLPFVACLVIIYNAVNWIATAYETSYDEFYIMVVSLIGFAIIILTTTLALIMPGYGLSIAEHYLETGIWTLTAS